MLANTKELLSAARSNQYAVGAFNIYNLEGATAVVQTAEELNSPVILQILPSALNLGRKPLIALCFQLANDSNVPVAVHLDHCPSKDMIKFALDCGISSIMADGSDLTFEENIIFTKDIVTLNRATYTNSCVEAELGKLSGEEDGHTVDVREASLTSPEQAVDFVKETGIDALAVCIGNIHGRYPDSPDLDFERLAIIADQVSIPLVLHGTSGLPDEMITESINLGVSKFNVNTEIRTVYLNVMGEILSSPKAELIAIMEKSITAMKDPIRKKIELFCSANRA